MSHWFFPSSWGYWFGSWNASWSRNVFWRGNIWREPPSGSGHLTGSGDVVDVRNRSFNCKVFNGQRVLLDAMIVNIRSIIPRDSLVRGIWNWSGRSDNEGCHSRHRISRGNPYGVNISIVFWEVVTPSGYFNIFDRNLVALRNGILHHVIILSTWLPQGIPYRWFSFICIVDLQLRHIFTQLLHRWFQEYYLALMHHALNTSSQPSTTIRCGWAPTTILWASWIDTGLQQFLLNSHQRDGQVIYIGNISILTNSIGTLVMVRHRRVDHVRSLN